MLLFVNASPRGASSESLRVAEALLEAHSDAGGPPVDRIDVFEDLHPFGGLAAQAKMAVIAGQIVPEEARAEWEQVQALAARVTAAETLVFAVPMWNGGIPWALKLFIDILTQPGVAFRFHPESGYEGLLHGRRAVAIYTSRVFAPGVDPAFGADHQSTYLSWWLAYCGITDVHELRLQPTFPTASLDQRRAEALGRARSLGAELVRDR